MKHKYLLILTLFTIQLSFGQIGFEENVIENTGSIDIPTEVLAVDIDGDGDLDVLSGSIGDDKVAWYENIDGAGTFGTLNVITTNADGVQAINAADLDGDNDIDVIALSHNADKVTWYENIDGAGTFGPEQVIVINTDGATVQTSLSVADLDGDNDMDIIVPFYGLNDKIAWYENTDGLGDFSVEHVITTAINSPNFVFNEDFDGDGDRDILSVSTSDGKLAWYENTDGSGNFGPQQIIRQQFSMLTAFAVDIDGDNDIDVVSSMGITSNELAWYENTDGTGTFGPEQVITTNLNFASSIYAADIDDDGDIDLVTASKNDDTLAWYENIDGSGTFGSQQVYSTTTDGPISVVAADIDNDNRIDLVSASQSDDKISWFKNLGVVVNEINGTIRLDTNANGCDTNDLPMTNILIETTDGVNSLSTYSVTNGIYQLFPDEDGMYETQIVGGLPDYYGSNPVSQTSNFTGLGNVDTVDFCIEPITPANDLNITIYPSIDDPRPGFDTTYQLVYGNTGTTQLSGEVTFEFDNAKMQFLTGSETVTSQTSNTLTFSYSNLNPFETRTIDLLFNVFAPPTTNIDDVLVSTATITPVSGDETEEDNTFELEQIVIGSYDPNDIRVLEGDEVLIDDINKYLHYIIRFQNTGTASAINVRVEHVLDDKLDWTTMQLQSMSHSGRVEIINGSEVSFIFDNINLPDSTNDEPNSHGFIAFKVKPEASVVVGDVINGVADIYFDFNPPIITNTVSTEIVAPLSVAEDTLQNFSLYPNPVENEMMVTSKTTIDGITIYDINGRLLTTATYVHPKTAVQLDVKSLSEGLYFLEVRSEDIKQTMKFLKR